MFPGICVIVHFHLHVEFTYFCVVKNSIRGVFTGCVVILTKAVEEKRIASI